MGNSEGEGPQWSVEHGWPQQPKPVKNDYPACWDLVVYDLRNVNFANPVQSQVRDILIEDCLRRDAAGEKKYGVRLQPFNGRSPIQDTFEEILDALVYIRAAIFEHMESCGKVVTQQTEFKRVGLLRSYSQLMDAALAIRFILEHERKNESVTNPGDNRSTEESRHNQPNIIVP